MASFPVWTRDDHDRLKLALAQFPDGSPSFLDDIAKHLQKPVEEVTHYYNAFHVPKLHRLVRWTNDDHERFESARKQFEGSPSILDDIAKHLHQKPLEEVKQYYDKINPDKDDLPHNPDQESDSEDDIVTETETRKRQRTDQDQDEDHRLDDNVLVTEASQRQRTQDQQHRLDDNVLVAEASQRQRNQDQQHRLDDNVLVTEASLRQRNQDQQHMLDDNVLVTEASLRQRTQDQQHRLDDNVPVAEASKPPKNERSWTPEEHILFLEGLEYYNNKGKWKEISRDYVKTKTAAQVASHAQKYEKRQKLASKEGRRPSILDITLESIKGKQDFGKKDPPDDGGSPGSCLRV